MFHTYMYKCVFCSQTVLKPKCASRTFVLRHCALCVFRSQTHACHSDFAVWHSGSGRNMKLLRGVALLSCTSAFASCFPSEGTRTQGWSVECQAELCAQVCVLRAHGCTALPCSGVTSFLIRRNPQAERVKSA